MESPGAQRAHSAGLGAHRPANICSAKELMVYVKDTMEHEMYSSAVSLVRYCPCVSAPCGPCWPTLILVALHVTHIDIIDCRGA
jgi:hypothetical protein